MSKFCIHCGSPLVPEARFCGQCGRPVQETPAAPQPVAPPPPAAAPAEPILGIISLQRRKGLAGVETFNMVVTPQRLVMLPVTNKEMQGAVKAARDQARAEGKDFFGQIGAQLGWLNVLYRQYQETPLNLLLAQKPGSLVLYPQEIRSIQLRGTGGLRFLPDEESGQERPEMTIVTTAGKQKWELVNMSDREARNILRQVLGELVR